jgi:hypothetical protein
VLSLDAFSTRRASRDGLQNRCRECWRKDYIANREDRKATAAAGAHATLTRHRERLQQYLETHPCVDCGEDDIRCLEFDHRDPSQKLANVSALVAMHVRWERILAEIAKCDVRCASCHAKRTAEQRNSWRHQRWFLIRGEDGTSGLPRLERLIPGATPVRPPDPRFRVAGPGVFRAT